MRASSQQPAASSGTLRISWKPLRWRKTSFEDITATVITGKCTVTSEKYSTTPRSPPPPASSQTFIYSATSRTWDPDIARRSRLPVRHRHVAEVALLHGFPPAAALGARTPAEQHLDSWHSQEWESSSSPRLSSGWGTGTSQKLRTVGKEMKQSGAE